MDASSFHYWVNMDIEKILTNLEMHYEKITAEGHRNIRATHKTTLEITREDYLTPRGTCIIGIKASKAASDLSPETKRLLRTRGCRVYLFIVVGGKVDFVEAWSDPRLTLTNPYSIVVRKSNYVDNRTIAVNANKAARDIDRAIIEHLVRGEKVTAYLVVTKSSIKNFIKSHQITE